MAELCSSGMQTAGPRLGREWHAHLREPAGPAPLGAGDPARVSTVAVLALGALGGGFVTGLARPLRRLRHGRSAGPGTRPDRVSGLWLHAARVARPSPATLLGAFLGIRLYGRVNDRQFRAVVLWLLLASGVVLMVSNLR